MVAYYILVGGTFAVSWIIYLFRKRQSFLIPKKNYEVIVFFAIVIIMLSLRAESIGRDTERYVDLYRQIQSIPMNELLQNVETEFGYRVLEKLVSYVLRDPQLYLAFVALITMVPIAYLYYKEAELPLLVLSMFLALPVFHMAFTGLRQMVAIAFIVPAYYAVKEKKLLVFLILVAVAFLFHQSAFILLLLYPMYHLSMKIATLAVVVPTVILVLMFNSTIYLWLIRFLPAKFIERYNDVWDTSGNSVLVMFILLAVLAFFLVRTENLDEETAGLRNILILSVLLQCFAPINGFAMRSNYYYIVLLPIAVSRIIYRTDEDKKPFGIAAALGITAVMLFIFFYKGHGGQDGFRIFPYFTCFG